MHAYVYVYTLYHMISKAECRECCVRDWRVSFLPFVPSKPGSLVMALALQAVEGFMMPLTSKFLPQAGRSNRSTIRRVLSKAGLLGG